MSQKPGVTKIDMTGDRSLWAAVIQVAIEDAQGNVKGESGSRASKDRARRQAVEWLTKPSRDFDDVCHLAGLDPEAVRQRACRMFRPVEQGPGVVSDFEGHLGTGGGRRAQDISQIGNFTNDRT